jgi:hypothetical protein
MSRCPPPQIHSNLADNVCRYAKCTVSPIVVLSPWMVFSGLRPVEPREIIFSQAQVFDISNAVVSVERRDHMPCWQLASGYDEPEC